jgi:hypothetical protein
MLASKSTDARSTRGEDTRKENVTPIGNPALVKPMNKGIDEQEQKGVSVPSKAPSTFAQIPVNLPRIFLLLSGGKKLWIYDIRKIRTERRMNIFTTS